MSFLSSVVGADFFTFDLTIVLGQPFCKKLRLKLAGE